MFEHARLKLTAWYLLIIMLVSASFSGVIYDGISREVDRFSDMQRLRVERRLRDLDYVFRNNDLPGIQLQAPTDNELVNDVKHRLLLTLLAINGGIFVISGGLGYVLAGVTLKPIKQMLEEQNRFITDSSHELRTPITSLKSAIEVSLRDQNLNLNEAKQIIADNLTDVNKLQLLSDELLRLSQYQSIDKYQQFENVSLKSILENSIKQFKPVAKLKNIRITSAIEDINFKASKSGLLELFNILLDNAIKYSSKDKLIHIVSKNQDGSAIITVSDQGMGIAQKDLAHIFDRFYRADTARSKNGTGGFGLGLSIAKKIVNIHHGSIKVESKLGEGTTFIINLPIFS